MGDRMLCQPRVRKVCGRAGGRLKCKSWREEGGPPNTCRGTKPLRQVKVQRAISRKVTRRFGDCRAWDGKMGTNWVMVPRNVFWTDAKIFRLGAVGGSTQNFRVDVENDKLIRDVDTDILRRPARQGEASVMVALGVSYPGVGTVRFVRHGDRVNTEMCIDILANMFL